MFTISILNDQLSLDKLNINHINPRRSFLCMLGNFSCFCCRLLTFYKINFFKKFFQEHYQNVKQLVSRLDEHSFGLAGFILFANISAVDKSRS